MLFWQFVLTPIYNKFIARGYCEQLVLIGVLILLSWLFTRQPFCRTPFQFSSCITYSYAFYLGMVSDKIRSSHYNADKHILVVLPFIILYLSIPVIKLQFGTEVLIQNFATSVLMVAVIKIAQKKLSMDSTVVQRLSKYCMGVYIIHHFVLDLSLQMPAIRCFMNYHIWIVLLFFPVLVLLSVGVTAIGHKSRYLRYLF